jgi:excinuclease ABC subunit B
VLRKVPRLTVYPSSHYVTPKERLDQAIDGIRDELRERLIELRAAETSWSKPSGSSSAPRSTSR